MKRKPKATALPFATFRIQFLRVLKSSYQADSVITGILKDETQRELCAALLWLASNDARDRIAGQTKQCRDLLTRALDDAIQGARAMEFVYTKLDSKPHLAEYISTLRGDLTTKRKAVDVAFVPPKAYGRDRDWSIVRYAKTELESRLRSPISNSTLADLLNAADVVVGRKFAGIKTQVDEADVDMGLRRLNQRTFERMLPCYQQMMAEHYPQGSDLPVTA
jgi:hypothetical protein